MRIYEHGTAFCREILDGQFARRYDASGQWVGYWDMNDRACDFNGQLEEVEAVRVPVELVGEVS